MNRPIWRLAALVSGIIVVLNSPRAAFAAETSKNSTSAPVVCPVCGRINNPNASYSSNAANTLVRGTTNALFGWTELIRQPAQEARAGGSVFTGFAQGMRRSVQRTVAGAGEMLTFWTPRVDKKYIHFSTDCPICMRQQH